MTVSLPRSSSPNRSTEKLVPIREGYGGLVSMIVVCSDGAEVDANQAVSRTGLIFKTRLLVVSFVVNKKGGRRVRLKLSPRYLRERSQHYNSTNTMSNGKRLVRCRTMTGWWSMSLRIKLAAENLCVLSSSRHFDGEAKICPDHDDAASVCEALVDAALELERLNRTGNLTNLWCEPSRKRPPSLAFTTQPRFSRSIWARAHPSSLFMKGSLRWAASASGIG